MKRLSGYLAVRDDYMEASMERINKEELTIQKTTDTVEERMVNPLEMDADATN